MFWQTLPRPIIGLAPMDGVTDAAMRFITKKYGRPHLMFTEFTSVEGIAHGALKLMRDFTYDESQRPLIAQIFGSSPAAFYQAAIVVANLGFDGLDINMGCPAKSVEHHGAGAALITTPKLASKIIRICQQALQDFAAGITLSQAKVHPQIIAYLNHTNPQPSRRLLPLSIKTRIGYVTPVTQSWISHLLTHNLAAISLHGRTLKQMYSGSSDWEQIGRAAKLARDTSTILLGNGDIKSLLEAQKLIEQYQLDGVLIGRAAMGNPWVFSRQKATLQQRLEIALKHAQKYEQFFGFSHFFPMRKHLAWYVAGFPHAAALRQQLIHAQNSRQAQEILSPYLSSSPPHVPVVPESVSSNHPNV